MLHNTFESVLMMCLHHLSGTLIVDIYCMLMVATWLKQLISFGPCVSLCLLGERPECGESWSPAGGQHDPTGW